MVTNSAFWHRLEAYDRNANFGATATVDTSSDFSMTLPDMGSYKDVNTATKVLINHQSYFICQHEESHTIILLIQVHMWQATRKAAELIKLVTYCNNVNAYCAN